MNLSLAIALDCSVRLHVLHAQGGFDSLEADELRDKGDAAYLRLSMDEQSEVNRICILLNEIKDSLSA